MEYTFK